MGKASAEPPPWQAQLFDDFEDLLRPLKSSIIRSAGKKRNTGKKPKKSKSKEKPVSTPRRYARSFIIWISPTVAWCIGLGVEAVRELLVSSIKFMIKACILLIFGSAGYLTVWQH